MSTSAISTSSYANFATMVGVYDSTLYGGITVDTSTNFGSGDLNLTAGSSQYLANTNNYVSPSTAVGNGMTVTGWFYPVGTTQSTNAAIFDISSSSVASYFCLTCATGNNPLLTASYNGSRLTSNQAAIPNAWNFFAYTVMYTNTATSQFLYMNGTLAGTKNDASNTFLPSVTYNSSTIGYGPGLGYFNGKIDEFRFYTRVLSLPEVNVLYNYNYQNTTAVTPTISSIAVDASYSSRTVTNALVGLNLNGTFSYATINRSVAAGSTGTAASYNVSCASMISNSTYTAAFWTDVSSTVAQGVTYLYSVTPYILNTPGTTVSLSVST